jgi:hypothetical protein
MTTITNPADPMVQAIFLRVHLGLLAKGLKNSQLSGIQILAAASALTGRKYKRGQYQRAIEDLNNKLKETTNG